MFVDNFVGVLWECPAYSSLKDNFLAALQGMLGDEFEHFQSLGSFEKASFVFGSESWENKCGSMLDLVKSYIIDVWELRKVRLYGDNPSVQQSHSQIAPGELQGVAGGGGELCLEGETNTGISVCSSNVCSSTVCSSVCLCTECSLSSGSAHSSGHVVNGSSTMAASSITVCSNLQLYIFLPCQLSTEIYTFFYLILLLLHASCCVTHLPLRVSFRGGSRPP